VRVYLVMLLVVAVLNLLLAVSIGSMLFVRRSHDVMALIAAYVVIIIPTTNQNSRLRAPAFRHGGGGKPGRLRGRRQYPALDLSRVLIGTIRT
jgi:hypothetical protein